MGHGKNIFMAGKFSQAGQSLQIQGLLNVVPAELKANEEISRALDICEEGAFTEAELYALAKQNPVPLLFPTDSTFFLYYTQVLNLYSFYCVAEKNIK
jgi:hypothetical protein